MQIPRSRTHSLLKLIGSSIAALSMIVGVVQLATPTVQAASTCFGLGYSCKLNATTCGNEAVDQDAGLYILICMGPCNNASSLPYCHGYPMGGGGNGNCNDPGEPPCQVKVPGPN